MNHQNQAGKTSMSNLTKEERKKRLGLMPTDEELDRMRKTCPRCGKPLIAPVGGTDPDYCYHCDREYRYLDTVKKP